MIPNKVQSSGFMHQQKVIKKLKKYKYFFQQILERFIFNVKLYFRGRIFNTLLKVPLIKQYFKTYILKKLKTQSTLTVKHLFKPIYPKLITTKPTILEIGSGHGEAAKTLCTPNKTFKKRFRIPTSPLIFTAEYTKRFYKLTKQKVIDCTYIIPVYGDGYELAKLFAPNSIDLLLIMFPDPWHKKRHHKRRPLTAKNLKILYSILKSNGTLFITTDHQEYFNFIVEQVQLTNRFNVRIGNFIPQKWGIPETHYYRKWNKALKKSFYILATPKRD